MRGKRKSKSVNRTEHEPYASYPLPQHTTNLDEAVAWVATGRGSLRQAMRLFTVDKKTIKKNLLRFMNSEPVLMGRPGPPPRVQDLHMRKWLEQLLLSSLTPYKVDIVEEARRHAEEHGFKLGSGNKWWCLFKARNTDVVSFTPSLVESQRADSRLDEDQWRDFFAEASKALAEVDYTGRYIVNMDETSFHQNFITRAAARKVYSIRGRRSVPRRKGYQRKAVIVIAAVVANGETLPPTLLFDTKTVKGSHLRYCDREVILKGTGTGWSSSEMCTGEKVRTAIRVTGLVPHSVETFLRHAPKEHIRPKQEEADAKSLELLAQLASRIVPASDVCPASQESCASQDSPVTT